ncbi:MAG: hypothetical protein IJY50_07570 [Clostridia bacterium]|nr:hypothetical protein [Clostridia bacterium]
MRGESHRTTRCLATSAVLSALGVILLWLGALIEVLDLSMAAIASFLVVFAVIEMKGKWPWLIYAVTSSLSLLLLPNKTAGLIYALFAGFYPILKAVLEGRLSKAVAWILKILIFGVGAGVALLLAQFLFLVDLSWLWENWWYLLLLVPIFVLYDVAMTRVISAYIHRWRARFRFIKF